MDIGRYKQNAYNPGTPIRKSPPSKSKLKTPPSISSKLAALGPKAGGKKRTLVKEKTFLSPESKSGKMENATLDKEPPTPSKSKGGATEGAKGKYETDPEPSKLPPRDTTSGGEGEAPVNPLEGETDIGPTK